MFEKQYLTNRFTTHVAEFKAAFPDIDPPASDWWRIWLRKYPSSAISECIATLAKHPLKPRFSTASCGRALSVMLRDDAIRRAVPAVPAVAPKPEEPKP
jgi:hypothetical protein